MLFSLKKVNKSLQHQRLVSIKLIKYESSASDTLSPLRVQSLFRIAKYHKTEFPLAQPVFEIRCWSAVEIMKLKMRGGGVWFSHTESVKQSETESMHNTGDEKNETIKKRMGRKSNPEDVQLLHHLV